MSNRGKQSAAVIFFVLCLVFYAFVGYTPPTTLCFRPVRPSVRPSVYDGVSVIIY